MVGGSGLVGGLGAVEGFGSVDRSAVEEQDGLVNWRLRLGSDQRGLVSIAAFQGYIRVVDVIDYCLRFLLWESPG